MPRLGTGEGLLESWLRHSSHAEYWIDATDIRTIEKVDHTLVSASWSRAPDQSQGLNADFQVGRPPRKHAREAAGINPNDAFFQDTLADSFNSLRRFQEAINAEKQALRLSDGKYAWMHFRLGISYFDTENWEAARQSFEKAAQLDPKDGDAAYNVALCLVRLGFYRDAASWYEEVLRRSPNHPERQEILSSIQALRN